MGGRGREGSNEEDGSAEERRACRWKSERRKGLVCLGFLTSPLDEEEGAGWEAEERRRAAVSSVTAESEEKQR